jgi:hypothetical protein
LAHSRARQSGRSAPSGAGRRRGTIAPLDPTITCACSLCVLCYPVVVLVAGNAAQAQRRQAPAARRRTPACLPPHPARERPGPSNLARMARIAYPFILNGQSIVDPCTGCTARSTVLARVGDRWILDPRRGVGNFVKEALSNSDLACRSFHLSRSLQLGPEFCS